MKRLCALFLAVAALLAFPAPVRALAARAEESELYAVADAKNVYLYTEPNDNAGLFAIPYTYYVKITALGDPFCCVEYQEELAPYRKIAGYCKKAELTFVDFIPRRPYLKREITVTYTLPNSSPALSDQFLQSVDVTYLFYGTFTVGSAQYCYVYGDGKFGYIPVTEEIEYDLNTDYLVPASGAADSENESARQSLSGVRIFLICLACASVVAIAVFVLRGKKSPTPPREDPSDF